MAAIKAFRGLRPRPDLAEKVAELPYDVLSSDEARQVAEGNQYSFFSDLTCFKKKNCVDLSE